MRRAIRSNPQRIQVARGVSIPAPVGGWDAISSQAGMPEDRALSLINMFPQPGYIELRGGSKRHRQCAGGVESLMAYHGMTSSQLFAAAGTSIFETSTSATATASVAVSALSNARWQHINFSGSGGHFLWIANGADAPRYYDGSVWATASLSGVTPAHVISAAVYKERIWLCIDNEISPYYLNVDSIQGTATQFPLTGVFDKGGELQAIGSWNFGSDGPDNFIAFVTSRGEVAVYSGDDPNTNFSLRGVFPIGEPLGRRCLTKVQGDLAFVSIDGVVPLSKAIYTDRGAYREIALTKNIQPVMNQSARLYKDNFGWQLIGYPKGTQAVLNVPVAEGSDQVQYAMNTISGAWCEYQGLEANCWELFNDRLFWGNANGFVYEADSQGFDDDGAITYDMQGAFNYCGARGQLKQWTLCRPILATDGQVQPGLGISVDFDVNDDISTPTATVESQSLWDHAIWDVDVWGDPRLMVTDWTAVSGLGYCVSIHMRGDVRAVTGAASQSLLFQIFGFDLQMQDGGLV